MIRITALAEDTSIRPDLEAEHGISFWVESRTCRLLFDTGQGRALPRNAAALDADLPAARSIVLSHGHYDHTGGLRCILGLAPRARLFFHPEAMKRRYAGGEGGVREIGLASVTEAELRKEEARLMWTTSPTEAAPGMWVTGEIPRRTDFEDTGGEFFLDPSCTKRDPIPDDQALWLDTGPGLIVLLGCAHAGVINTLRYIRRLTGRKIRAVIGGMHLIHAPERRLSLTLAALRDMDVRLLAPGHCTGERAVCGLKSGLPDRVSCCSAGMRWTFSEDGD